MTVNKQDVLPVGRHDSKNIFELIHLCSNEKVHGTDRRVLLINFLY
jgi:hypothetical protein